MSQDGAIIDDAEQSGKTSFTLLRTITESDRELDDFVTDLAFNPNGEALAMVYRWGDIQVQDVITGEPLLRLHVHSECRRIGLGREGEVLAVGCDHGVYVWRLRDGELLKHFAGTKPLFALTSFSGSPVIAVVEGSGPGKSVVSWGLDSDEELYRIGHTHTVEGLAFEPDVGDLLVTSARSVVFWECSLGRNDILAEVEDGPGEIGWQQDKLIVASTSSLHLYRVTRDPGPSRRDPRVVPSTQLRSCKGHWCLDSAGRRLLYDKDCHDYSIRVRDLASGKDLVVSLRVTVRPVLLRFRLRANTSLQHIIHQRIVAHRLSYGKLLASHELQRPAWRWLRQ